jgi:hypothetical protein
MEELIKKASETIQTGESMTDSAIKIAVFALRTFNEAQLRKALAISEAIINFEDSLKDD